MMMAMALIMMMTMMMIIVMMTMMMIMVMIIMMMISHMSIPLGVLQLPPHLLRVGQVYVAHRQTHLDHYVCDDVDDFNYYFDYNLVIFMMILTMLMRQALF